MPASEGDVRPRVRTASRKGRYVLKSCFGWDELASSRLERHLDSAVAAQVAVAVTQFLDRDAAITWGTSQPSAPHVGALLGAGHPLVVVALIPQSVLFARTLRVGGSPPPLARSLSFTVGGIPRLHPLRSARFAVRTQPVCACRVSVELGGLLEFAACSALAPTVIVKLDSGNRRRGWPSERITPATLALIVARAESLGNDVPATSSN